MGQKEVQINAIGENLFAVAIVVLQAEEYVKLFSGCPVLGSQIGIVVFPDLFLPGQRALHRGVAQKEVVSDDNARIALLEVGLGQLLGGADCAGAAPGGVAVGLVEIGMGGGKGLHDNRLNR